MEKLLGYEINKTRVVLSLLACKDLPNCLPVLAEYYCKTRSEKLLNVVSCKQSGSTRTDLRMAQTVASAIIFTNTNQLDCFDDWIRFIVEVHSDDFCNKFRSKHILKVEAAIVKAVVGGTKFDVDWEYCFDRAIQIQNSVLLYILVDDRIEQHLEELYKTVRDLTENGNFFCDQMISDALIHTLIMTTEQYHILQIGNPVGQGLI